MNRNNCSKDHDAFSLVELLIVVGIIALIASMAMGGLNNVLRASKVTTTAQVMADQINLARQIATARNLPVEVRIYSLPYFDMTNGGAFLYRGMQLFVQGSNAVSSRVLFADRIVARETSMLGNGTTYTPFNLISTNWGPFKQGQYGYQSFYISPNGRATSGGSNTISNYNNWFIIQNWEQNARCNGSAPMPKNYALVLVNPITSKANVLRP